MKSGEKILRVFCFLTATVFFSCSKSDDVGDEIDQIEIKFLQRFVDGSTEPYLLCTGGNYDCAGVPIAYQFYKTDEVLYLNFGATYGGPCNSSSNSSPAYTYVYPGYLKNGNYMFEISNRGQTLHSTLKVEDNKYTVLDGVGSTVTFKDNPSVCHLTPEDAIWGSVYSIPPSKEHYFIDSLYALGAVPYAPLLENGSYYYYSVSDGVPVIDAYGSSDYTYFLLKSSLDTALLRSIINYFDVTDTIRVPELKTGKGGLIKW